MKNISYGRQYKDLSDINLVSEEIFKYFNNKNHLIYQIDKVFHKVPYGTSILCLLKKTK
jgi:hypothetical protein